MIKGIVGNDYGVVIRSFPDIMAKPIGTAELFTELKILNMGTKWSEIEFNGAIGYVPTSQIIICR